MCRQDPSKVLDPVPKSPKIQDPESRILKSSSNSKNLSQRTSEKLSATKRTLIFTFPEISEATDNFQSPKLGNSPTWKCTLRGKTVVVSHWPVVDALSDSSFQSLLSDLCQVRHGGIAELIGGYKGERHVYVIHTFEAGADLHRCLHGGKLVGFSVLSKWINRIRIASDVAKALEYLHHDIALRYVHKHVKSSGIIVSEPGFRAKLAHFGSHILTGHVDSGDELRRQGSRIISGTHGYMAPEYVASGVVTQKNDVYAFGVVLLELLTGEEAVRFVREEMGAYRKISLVEGLTRVDGDAVLRSWMDGRLKDSYPLDCVQRVVQIARACVDLDPHKRPEMRWVSHELSRVLIKSEKWETEMRVNEEITVSLVGR